MSDNKKWSGRACGLLVLILLAAAPDSYRASGSYGSYGSPDLQGTYGLPGSGRESAPGALGLERGRPGPPGPDYSKSLRKRSPNDPEVFRTDLTNRRDDNANNNPNR